MTELLTNQLKEKHVGERNTVHHCKDAINSFYDALGKVPKNNRAKYTRFLILQFERLGKGERLSKDNFPQEGVLPNKIGQDRVKHFYALKRIPIRGYCWLSEKHKGTYFISHYTVKKKNKLDASDTNKVHSNWTRIEVNDDEC